VVKVDAAIIGGTGVGDRIAEMNGDDLAVNTPFGEVNGRLIAYRDKTIFALQRHSKGHKTPPHLVNYRAIALALQSIEVKACFSSAAVGSLRSEWGPGTLAVCTDMIDLTGRRLTLFSDLVQHTDMSKPFPASDILAEACKSVGAAAQARAVYVGCDGPRYESPAEVRYLQIIGGDVVGMTASSEAILMREAGVPYSCLAVVTNLGCGLSTSELHHGEVTDVMKSHGRTVVDILLAAASSI